MKEYKEIPGWERYGISTDGELKNLETGRTFRGGFSKNGYLTTKLTDSEGKQKGYYIHVLMGITYLGHVPCGHKIVVDHKDTLRKFDNSLENLQLITQRENATKDRKGGTSKYPGVNWQTLNKKWRAQIVINGKLKHLGYFLVEEQAAEAYQTALRNHLSGGSDI